MPDPSPLDRPKARTLKPLRALLPFLRPYRGMLLFALVALLVAAAAMLALPIAFRYLIDEGLSSRSTETINRYFIAFMAAAAVYGVFAALRFYLVTWLGERVVADLRSAVYARVIRMDPSFFEITRVGEVLSRLTADTTLVQSIAGVNLSITLRSAISLLGSLVMLAVTSPKLTGMIVVLMPVVLVPLIVLGRRVRSLSRASQDRIADTSSIAEETLNAIQTVQAFTLERVNAQRFDLAVENSFGAAVRRTRTRSTLTAMATMLVFGAITFVLWMGAHAVVRGEMTGGQLGQFLMYAVYVAIAAASLSEMWGEVQRGAGAMERLVELQHAEPMIVAPANPVPLPMPGRGEIRFEQVTFHYPSRPESKALDAFDLHVRPGETIAFVGPSGAGKTTAFQLLLRFYDPATRSHPDRRRGRDPRRPAATAQSHRARAAGHRAVCRHGAREHPVRAARCERCRSRSGRDRGGGRSFPAPIAGGLRHVPGRTRGTAVGRTAPAHRHRSRDPARPADSAAG